MKRLFFAVFGFYGLVVTCLDGVKPFLDFSLLVSWVVKNWLLWTRELWGELLIIIGISVPVGIADGLSGFVYCVSTVLGLRRIREFGIDRYIDAIAFYEKILERMNQFPKIIRWALRFIAPYFLFLPWIVVAILLFSSSIYVGWSFMIVSIIFNNVFGWLGISRLEARFTKWLIGEIPDGLESKDIVAFSFLSVPVFLLVVLFIILLLNEVAVQGDNIMNFVGWVRCDAGIEC